MTQENTRPSLQAVKSVTSTAAAIDAAALNAWRVGVIVELARTEACDHAPVGHQIGGDRVHGHVERVDAILAGAAALLRELHTELRAAEDRFLGAV